MIKNTPETLRLEIFWEMFPQSQLTEAVVQRGLSIYCDFPPSAFRVAGRTSSWQLNLIMRKHFPGGTGFEDMRNHVERRPAVIWQGQSP